jgi:indole-3-glycerol phosphate synthase
MSAATSTDFLAGMAASSRLRSEAARAQRSVADLRALIAGLPAAPTLSISSAGFDLIAECKLRSPAVGTLRAATEVDVAATVLRYADAGAAAVSVLTEPDRFDGSLEHLERAAAALAKRAVPAMRKDFLVDDYQVLEARAAGAGGVLLILRMLERGTLEAMLDTALEQNMFVLLEAFDAADIDLALRLLAPRKAAGNSLMLGVNCRDLVTLQVVPGRLEAMAAQLPHNVLRVAESGVESAEDAARLAMAGYDLALVGSALMKDGHPATLAAAMLGAARSARGHRGA